MCPQTVMQLIERGIFETTMAGKPAIVAFRQRDRATSAAVNTAVTFSLPQIKRARDIAVKRKLACYIAAEIFLKGKHQYSVAVPVSEWAKVKTGKADLPVNAKAREVYAGDKAVLENFNFTMGSPPKERVSKEIKRQEPPKAMTEVPIDLVDTIARSVAGETLSGAMVQLPPMTRAELYSHIHDGVQAAVKKAKIGFIG